MNRFLTAGLAATMFLVGGCVFVDGPFEPAPVPDSGGSGDWSASGPCVDTWLSIPTSVAAAIEPYVAGYFTPELSRYDSYLYPPDKPYACCDLPPYVRTDFNGDYIDDYAFLFSSEFDAGSEWELTTKLIVVLGSHDGPVVAANITLGVVIGSWNVAVEEYWAIGLVPAGSHTLTSWYDGVEASETVYLDHDAFYLAEQETTERSLFYADGRDIYEMGWFDGALAKKRPLAKRRPKVIRLSDRKK